MGKMADKLAYMQQVRRQLKLTPGTPPLSRGQQGIGTFDGLCNRSQCRKPGARWWNYGSYAHYCEECAEWLNTDEFNAREAIILGFPGGKLCQLQTEAKYYPLF